MKSIFNLSKGILSVALISVAFASCSEDTMDNINKDKDHTTSVPAKFILADVSQQPHLATSEVTLIHIILLM